MKSFKEYVELRNNHQFESGIYQLLLPVLEGKISFDDLVEQVIVPTFESQPYAENEMDILSLLQEGWWDKFKGMFGGGSNDTKPGDDAASARYAQTMAANRKGAGYSSPNDMLAKKQASRNSSITDPINQTLQKMIQSQLMPVVKNITDALKKSAFQTGNRQLHRAAELFNQKLTQTAESMKFKISGTLNNDQKSGFNQERMDSRYTPEQRARLADQQKQRQSTLANKAQGLTPDGRIPFDSVDDQGNPINPNANRPVGASRGVNPGNAAPEERLQNMDAVQRERLLRKLRARNQSSQSNSSNVIGGVGRSQNSFGNAATATA